MAAEFRMFAADLVPIVAPLCERQRAHLIEIVLRGRQGKPVVEIFIDAEDGVTNDMCSAVSREVEKVLDSGETVIFPQSYTLTVSSPGIDRPLKFAWQYKKHVGRKVAVRLKAERAELEMIGILLSVSDDGTSFEIEKGNEKVLICFADIAEAIVQTPW